MFCSVSAITPPASSLADGEHPDTINAVPTSALMIHCFMIIPSKDLLPVILSGG